MVRNPFASWLVRLLVAVIPLGVSCSQDPVAALHACQDDPCRLTHIDAAFEQHPEAVETVVRTANNAISAATLADHLAANNPEKARAICDWLAPKSIGHQRCRRFYDRPHLLAGHQPKISGEVAVGSRGPRSADLPRPDWGDPPWLAPSADSVHPEGAACWASHGGVEPSYSECLFIAAETRARRQQAGDLSDAYVLCAASQFAPMCFAHVLQFSAPPPPPANRPDPVAVARARLVADELSQLLASQPAVLAVHLDRYWAVWVYSAFRIADAVTGDLLTLLPAEAGPHIRAAAAMRFLTRHESPGLEFHQVVQAVSDRLRVRTGAAESPDPKTPLVNLRNERWLDIRVLERELPSVFLMGPGRRAVAEDPGVDLQIAVLEAAGQRDPTPPAAFFLAVVGGQSHELVRWTGARIGAQLDPAAAHAMTDPSALVGGRLTGQRRP